MWLQVVVACVLLGGALLGFQLAAPEYHGIVYCSLAWASVVWCFVHVTLRDTRYMPLFATLLFFLCAQLGVYVVYHRV